jgi:hypothetical protein
MLDDVAVQVFLPICHSFKTTLLLVGLTLLPTFSFVGSGCFCNVHFGRWRRQGWAGGVADASASHLNLCPILRRVRAHVCCFARFFLIALFSSWRALIHHALLCRTPRDLDEFQVNPAQVFEFIYSGHHHAVSLSFHRWATILTASRLRRIMALLQTRQGQTRKMI